MLKVYKPGFYTSIQDLGRFEFQEYGVPVSGVMDFFSAKLANAILGNNYNCAVLEITLTGPKLEFLEDTIICITGADLTPCINGINTALHNATQINKGDILTFQKLKYGCRCYLSVLGGFQTEIAMNSRSMYKNITTTFRIKKDDILNFNPSTISFKSINNASVKLNTNHFKNTKIEVYKGPEFHELSEEQINFLLNSKFTISNENSRMAYQLVETLSNSIKPIITSLVLPGTVQLTPSGKLLILMRDCQTTGGYPRVLQLSEHAINTLAQKFTNDKIQFKLVK